MKPLRVLGVLAILLAVLVAALGRLAWRPSLSPIEPRDTSAYDPALIKRGANLAAIGNCNVCHTAPSGKIFAGGRALSTPYGTIHSTNITPDPETGIGRWSEEAFARSLREGLDREGQHLYPAFPYDHFTKITDADIQALYAYFMTRAPVRSKSPDNDLMFPLNFRPLLAGWKWFFFRAGTYQTDPGHDAEWNRGAYLVEGLGHCGACHTPRNALGAEKQDQMLAGGVAEGWNAYAIDRSSPAPIPWDAQSLAAFLRNGWHPHHGISRGPMAPVTRNLGSVPYEDVQAMATYLADRIGPPDASRRRAADELLKRVATSPPQSESDTLGAMIFAGACESCHDGSRPLPYGGINLHLSTAPSAPDPRNIINVTRHGLPPADGQPSPIMPGFAGALNDEQLSALLQYMRSQFSDQPPWEEP